MTMSWSPVLERSFVNSQPVALRLRDPIIDEYLAFAGSRLRHNSWLAVAFDLKVFFSVIRKPPAAVSTADVFAFINSQRAPRHGPKVVRLEDGEVGCEVLGLRLRDLSPGEQRLFIAEGKGGHQRSVPVSKRFFASLAEYLTSERPETQVEQVFVVLKGPRRGLPLSAYRLDEIVEGARQRAGLARLTCHQLRHTCLTRLREAGMALEAVQFQAGHRSIESTRIYLHLANSWLVQEYTQAVDALEADLATPGSGGLEEV
jgi:integrase